MVNELLIFYIYPFYAREVQSIEYWKPHATNLFNYLEQKRILTDETKTLRQELGQIAQVHAEVSCSYYHFLVFIGTT